MSLLSLAESDLQMTLEDTVMGFGREMVFTPTAGDPITVGGQFIRRGLRIEPTTGLAVAADEASFSVRLSRFATLPTDGWTVAVADITGTVSTYKILAGKLMIDRTLGIITGELKRMP